MAKRLGIKAKVRAEIGGRRPRRIRASGRVPAVLYGSGTSQALELNGREIAEALHGASSESVLIDLTLESEGGATTKKMALIREVQHDPCATRSSTLIFIRSRKTRNFASKFRCMKWENRWESAPEEEFWITTFGRSALNVCRKIFPNVLMSMFPPWKLGRLSMSGKSNSPRE